MFDAADERAGRRAIEPLPGWLERGGGRTCRRPRRSWRGCRRADEAAAHRGAGAAEDGVVMRIHQVLATLGYGDAIGHEVLGIQRVLRAAGYESEIFVETADRGSSR